MVCLMDARCYRDPSSLGQLLLGQLPLGSVVTAWRGLLYVHPGITEAISI